MVMISMPMNYLAWRSDYISIKDRLEAKGYKVTPLPIDEIYEQSPKYRYPVKTIPLVYMSNSFARMAISDTVYFANGWENARGCRLEHQAAKDYGLNILYEGDENAH
jgi:hypothetical protein